jgi:NADPH-dependent 2,4-dienoyl-CoA reductase/sulfur reductase-like enzyme
MNAVDPNHTLLLEASAKPAAVHDVAVIGAGPAGIAASLEAVELGLDVVLIDEQPAAGGQIYRALEDTPLADRGILDSDYWRGAALITRLRSAPVRTLYETTVWAVVRTGAAFDLCTSSAGHSSIVHAKHVIIATGAQERPFPINGWTLPGVMTAGAAQILLKTSGLVPDVPTVLAGSGPLLYLLAAQYAAAGARIDYILDTTPPGRWRGSASEAAEFARSPYVTKGLALMRRARKSARFIAGVTQLRAIGNGKLQHVSFVCGEHGAVVPASLLLLHQGVVPSINLSNAMGLAHHWDDAQCCFVPTVDEWGAASAYGVTIAGDAAGIGGARAAEARGGLAALHAACSLGRIDEHTRDAQSAPAAHELSRWMRGRAFLDRWFQPAPQFRVPAGDAIVCRCEEVTAQQVVEAVRAGCTGPNQVKAFLRCGMGPCQGRMCGLTVTELIARERGMSPAETGYYRLRFPIKPITLGELASLPATPAALDAVVRAESDSPVETDR